MTGQQVLSRWRQRVDTGSDGSKHRNPRRAGSPALEATNRPAGAPLERFPSRCRRLGNGGTGRRGGAGPSDNTALFSAQDHRSNQ